MIPTQRLAQLFQKTKVDAIIIDHQEPSSDNNFFCFTGITNATFHYAAAVLFPQRIHLLVAQMEAQEAKATKIKYSVHGEYKLKDILVGATIIGVDGSKYPMNKVIELKKAGYKVRDVSSEIVQCRIVKTPNEIKALTKAASIASIVADNIPSYLSSGMTELELAAQIEYEMKLLGSLNPAFETIVAFGKHAADPHHMTGMSKLQRNSFVLCDFGATVNNLRSDITRTFFYGKASKQQHSLYNLVLQVQIQCCSALISHSTKELYKDALHTIRRGVQSLNLKGGMTHSLGHGLGFDVHEDRLINGSNIQLPIGSITTIEPGAYIPGFGGVRIEDDILITKKGIKILTTASKEFIEVQVQ